jgi:hypothetical protein
VERPLTSGRGAALATCLVVLLGCAPAHPPRAEAPVRRFAFASDTFAFPNQSRWILADDPVSGATVWAERDTELELRCSAVVRTARQFLVHAVFAPEAPRLPASAYPALVREVLARDARAAVAAAPPVVIPGFADLRQLTREFAPLFRDELERDWRSVLTRDDWRIVVPFTPAGQEREAEVLLAAVRAARTPIIRVLRFPHVSLNHALLVFDGDEDADGIHLRAYDPNDPRAPVTITFDRAAQTFVFPPRIYFAGGPIKVYEIYRAGLFG